MAQDATELYNMYMEISQKIGQGDKPNYLVTLKEFEDNKKTFEGTFVEQMVNQSLSTLYSFVGDYDKALKTYQSIARKDQTVVDKGEVKDLKVADAKKTILEEAKDHRIVIINENPHIPLHRAFTHSLLSGLKEQGFNHLALEDLSVTEEEINERKYPIKRSGYYMLEPVFGDMVRTALQMDYELVCYDYHAFMELAQRDSMGVTYLKKILDEDANAKILIHLFHEHVNENDKTIGYWIKELTGIDPLTINQIDLTETGAPEYDNAYYTYIQEELSPKNSSVLIKGNENWVLPKRKGANDLQVIHPATTYKDGRPNWLFDVLDRKAYKVTTEDFDGKNNFLLQAFYKEELDTAIPVDQLWIKEVSKDVTLALPKGAFTLKMVNVAGEVIKEWEVTVK